MKEYDRNREEEGRGMGARNNSFEDIVREYVQGESIQWR